MSCSSRWLITLAATLALTGAPSVARAAPATTGGPAQAQQEYQQQVLWWLLTETTLLQEIQRSLTWWWREPAAPTAPKPGPDPAPPSSPPAPVPTTPKPTTPAPTTPAPTTPAPTTPKPTTPAPASTDLPLVRRTDPSLDRYLRDPSFHAAIRRQVSRLVAHDSDPAVSLSLTSWHPHVDVYVNATGVLRWHAAQVQQASAWLVKDAAGTPVLVDDWYMLDVRSPAARRWWLRGADGIASCNEDRTQRRALDLVACGYDGLWLDNVLLATDHFRPPPGIDEGSWANGVAALVSELRAALPAGFPLTANMKWNDIGFGDGRSSTIDAGSPFGRAVAAVDQVLIEGGATSIGPAIDGREDQAWSLRRLLRFADEVHRVGGNLQWEKTGSDGFDGTPLAQTCNEQWRLSDSLQRWQVGDSIWQGHVRTAQFNLASALLAATPGDNVGDMCEYPDRSWGGYTGADLGDPLSAREEVGGLLIRRFARGGVVVNTSAQARTLDVDRATVEVGSGVVRPAGQLTVAPLSAMVLRNR